MPYANKEDERAYQRKWSKIPENRERRRGYKEKVKRLRPERHKFLLRSKHLRLRFGLSIEQFDSMVLEQGSKCAICLEPFTATPFVDHCHDTGNVRGLLCRNCNTALGAMKDSPQRLVSAAEYLNKNFMGVSPIYPQSVDSDCKSIGVSKHEEDSL